MAVIFVALFALLFVIGGTVSHLKKPSPNLAPALVYIFIAAVLVLFIIKNH